MKHNPEADRYYEGILEAIRGVSQQHGSPVSEVSAEWKAEVYTVAAAGSRQVCARNPARVRAVLSADGGNTTAIWYGPTPYTGDTAPGPGDGMAALAAGAAPVELHHTGAVHIWSSAGGSVHVLEEYKRVQ